MPGSSGSPAALSTSLVSGNPFPIMSQVPLQPLAPLGPWSSSASGMAPNSSRQGLILSPASDPIPHRLVQRIRAGEFVDMRDLLADNISLHNQLEALHGQASLASPASLQPRLREVPSLSSWLYCFAAYMAVLTTDPRTQDMLAYCRLIIKEALRHGGTGWQEYDRTFRRQAAIDSSLPWNTLVPGLQAATLVGPRGASWGTFCTLCREPDHNANQCALSVMQQRVRSPAETPKSFDRRYRRPETVLGICSSWNRGTCAFPLSCTYRHVCGACQGRHKRFECPDAQDRPESHQRQFGSIKNPGPFIVSRP